MKLLFIDKVQKGAVVIHLVEGTLTKFVEKDGVSELHIGYGKEKTLSRRKMVLFMRKVISVSKQYRLKIISIDWNEVRVLAVEDIGDVVLGEITAIAFLMANFEFVQYKKKPEEGFIFVETVTVTGTTKQVQSGFRRGEIVGEEVNACRTLSNTPGGDMTPNVLANATKKAFVGTKGIVKILGRKEMEKLGMGAVLGIAKGSIEEPKFIIVEYWGATKSEKPVVLVGKGVTFDSGGLNIKHGNHMYEMHLDMSGGAAVIHAVALAAKLGLKVNVIGLVPAVENMPGNNAVRPGDILKSLSGKTIEVLNTDAEGRVILADGITYAKRYNPKVVVDVATLTGAVCTALGTQASGLMSNNQVLETQLHELGELSGDYVWPLPLWDEYEDMVKGHFADIPNISTAINSHDGGAISGGMFLLQFAKELDCPWAHLDIASRMTSAPGEFLARGAAGTPVRLLLALIESAIVK